MFNNDAHNHYLIWAGGANSPNAHGNSFFNYYQVNFGDSRQAGDPPYQPLKDGHWVYDVSRDLGPNGSLDANVAWALPTTDDYNEFDSHQLAPIVNWPTRNAYMGIWCSYSQLAGSTQHVLTSPENGILTELPRFYDAQGSPMHLADICRQLLIERYGYDYGMGFDPTMGALGLVSGVEDTAIGRFMHGWGGAALASGNDLGTSTESNDRINALCLHDLRFYIRAGQGMSYRPHLSAAVNAYNINGYYQDFMLDGQTGNVSGEEAATFSGNWTSTHSEAFTAPKTARSLDVGFYLDGTGETDGSPTGDYWEVNRNMTSTLNQAKTYEIWLKPARADRQSLFFGSGTIQHIEIYPNSLNFRTEATTQNGYSFGANYNTGVNLEEFKNVDGRDASDGFAVNKWNCLTITFNTGPGGDGTVKWYCNGYHFHTGNMYAGNSGEGEYFSFMGIGRATGSSSYLYAKSFKGYFDEFKIYDKVLTDIEIVNNVRSSRHFRDYYVGSDKGYTF